MCGIVGVLGAPDADAAPAVEKALGCLRHRGPDATNVVAVGRGDVACTFGHSRLRIIDIDPSADQPLSDPSGSLWVVYNGEVYNHLELRGTLEQAGYRFRTKTDTEILVHLYDHVGGDPERMLTALRGMFAFGLFDRRRNRLLLARDRLGIKPLYWATSAGRVVFGSEARAVAATGVTGARPDHEAVRGYLTWGVVQRPRTIFEGVSELAPGSYATWENGVLSERIWWTPSVHPRAISRPEAVEELRAVLRDAVQRHLVADRPVGIFLSSGVDSSAVAALAAAVGTDTVRTLTVALPGSTLDETQPAQAFARSLGVHHERVAVEGIDIADAVSQIIGSMDQPTSDGVNTWFVSRAARDAGLVVVLTGLGGDELFGGYPSFRLVPKAAQLLRPVQRLPTALRVRGAAQLSKRRPGGRGVRLLEAEPSFEGAYRAVRGLFAASEAGAGAAADFGATVPWGSEEPSSDGDRVTLMELTNYQSNQLLRDTDQMSMAHSLEARVPLLDDEVVRLCLSLPADIRTETGKGLLREAAGLPATLTKRPFDLPFDAWLRNDLAGTVRDALLSEELPFADLVPAVFRRRVWESFEAGRTHWSRPWAIAVMRLWPAMNGYRW